MTDKEIFNQLELKQIQAQYIRRYAIENESDAVDVSEQNSCHQSHLRYVQKTPDAIFSIFHLTDRMRCILLKKKGHDRRKFVERARV